MYHTIEFAVELVLDLEISRTDWLQIMHVIKGTRLKAQLKPYVVESATGPVEVADLFFDDGSASSGVPFACFSFVD
jgi:hypothetical protein